jgi:Zn-dependent M32 family carboxypeptidase
VGPAKIREVLAKFQPPLTVEQVNQIAVELNKILEIETQKIRNSQSQKSDAPTEQKLTVQESKKGEYRNGRSLSRSSFGRLPR